MYTLSYAFYIRFCAESYLTLRWGLQILLSTTFFVYTWNITFSDHLKTGYVKESYPAACRPTPTSTEALGGRDRVGQRWTPWALTALCYDSWGTKKNHSSTHPRPLPFLRCNIFVPQTVGIWCAYECNNSFTYSNEVSDAIKTCLLQNNKDFLYGAYLYTKTVWFFTSWNVHKPV